MYSRIADPDRVRRWLPVVVALTGYTVFPTLHLIGQSPDQSALKDQVSDFVSTWLDDQAPDTAVRRHLSEWVDNDRLLPPETDTDSPPAAPLGRPVEDPSGRMATFLSQPLQYSRDSRPRFVPVERPAALEFISYMSGVGIEVETMAETPFLSYKVTDWNHISWTAAELPGLHDISPNYLSERGLEMRAVVGRLQLPYRSELPVPFLMLWSKTEGSEEDWKLWSVVGVPPE